MTVAEVFQLYVPLAGLVGLAFWVGVLSQRVRGLEDRLSDEKGDAARLVRVETVLTAQAEDLKGLRASIDGLNRSLSNLMTGRGSQVIELNPRLAE